MPTLEEQRNIACVQAYLDAVDTFQPDTAAAELAADVVQREHPSALTPKLRESNREAILTGVREAQYFLTSQRTEVVRTVASGDQVAVEMTWAGVMRGEMGPLKAGDVLRAHGAFFFTLHDGKIATQDSHYCFEVPSG